MRILIVEDDENDQLLIKRVLNKSDINYDSACVDNREGFILQLDTFKPDLILCDYSQIELTLQSSGDKALKPFPTRALSQLSLMLPSSKLALNSRQHPGRFS